MRRFAGCLLLCIIGSLPVQAEPANVYRTLPDPSYQLVTVNKQQTIIQDSRGFFVGYYKPLPPLPPPFVPQPKPRGVWAGISTANAGFPGYGYTNGYVDRTRYANSTAYSGLSSDSGSDSGSSYGWDSGGDCSGSFGGHDCGGSQDTSSSSASSGSSYSDPGGSPLCSPDYGFGR